MRAVGGREAVPEAAGLVPLAYRILVRYLCGMDDKGYKRTSVHLSAELAERVDASGSKLPDLIRRGLDAEPLEDMLRRVVREEVAAALGNGAKIPAGTVPFREAGQ